MVRARVAAVIVVLVAAGCSSETGDSVPPTPTTAGTAGVTTIPPTPKERAQELCREAVPDPAKLVSSYPTTVGAIRNVTIGTPVPSQPQAFPSRKASEFGAWCWTRPNGNNFDVYKVTPGIHAVLAVHLLDFNLRDAHGAPAIP